jgi:hypothetical protein
MKALVITLALVMTAWAIQSSSAGDAYCQGYRDAWIASSDPYLNWQDVAGCDGQIIHEDDPRWNCATMGNLVCGP